MTIQALGIYESVVNGKKVRIKRLKTKYWLGNLYIDGFYKGKVPFYQTVKKVQSMENKNYPTYKFKKVY